MSNKKCLYTEEYIQDTADAIRSVNGSNDKYKVNEFGTEIRKLVKPSGTLEISENGTYDVINYASTNVNAKIGTISDIYVTSSNGNFDYINFKNVGPIAVKWGMNNLDLSMFNLDAIRICGLISTSNSGVKTLNITGWDASMVTITDSNYHFLQGASRLTTIAGCLQDLGKAYDTSKQANYGEYFLYLSFTQLDHDSIMNMINGLYDIASKGCNTQSLRLGTALKSKLTSAEIAIATNKGWTVS